MATPTIDTRTTEARAQAAVLTGPAPADRAGDEAAIRALFAQLQDAWARADADAYVAAFTDDADYVVFDGTHLRGRREIADAHVPLWNGILKGSTLVGVSSSIQFLTADVALVHGKGAVRKRREKKPSKRSLSVQTLVAVRQDGTWRFAAFQNTRYRPFAETLFGKLVGRMMKSPAQNQA
jgi:uncharacterized protein (TIGR02246 family)